MIEKYDQIHIRDLLLRTIIGFNHEERIKRQDVLLSIILYADLHTAGWTDDVVDAVNYRTITKRVIAMVEASSFNLVERLAAETATICLMEPRVKAVQVRIEKPGALRFARSVGVEIYRTREDLNAEPNRVMIAIGSNIEPEINIRQGVKLLSTLCDVIKVSSVYLTEPVGTKNQPAFLNAALVISTPLSAVTLKQDVLFKVEKKLKRVRVEDKNAPRTLDLDIVLFNYDVFECMGRHIPDPDLLKYAHIAVPLAEIAPYYVHPETGQTLKDIAMGMSLRGITKCDDIVMNDIVT